MALSILDDKARKPKDRDLADVLGRTKVSWDGLIDHVARECGGITQEWKHSGKNYGWSLRLKLKKRTILYMIPCERHFLVAFVYGKRAVEVARQSNLPQSVIDTINEARTYVEGTGFRLEIREKKDLDSIKKLVAIKMAN